MAAREQQLEPFVLECLVVHLVLDRFLDLEQACLLGERALAADPVDCPVARGDREPGPRVVGQTVARPALGGDRERLLRGFLGEIEVAEEADQVGDDAPPLVAEDLLRQRITTGRTSMEPCRAAGMRAATAIASSRLSAS
jgi:hypothetical protein